MFNFYFLIIMFFQYFNFLSMYLFVKYTLTTVPWLKYKPATAFPRNCTDCGSVHILTSYINSSIPLTENTI